MNAMFSEKYVKDKLNRLEQVLISNSLFFYIFFLDYWICMILFVSI